MLHLLGFASCAAVGASDDTLVRELAEQVAAQSAQIAALMTTVAEQAEQISALQAAGPRERPQGADPASARPLPAEGRRLSGAPATQKTAWHGSVLHTFDEPTTCGLEADLHSATHGPLKIKRSDDALNFGYASTAFNISAPLTVTHARGCNGTTVVVNGALSASATTFSLQANLYENLRGTTLSAVQISHLALMYKISSGFQLTIRSAKWGRYLSCGGNGIQFVSSVTNNAEKFLISSYGGQYLIMCEQNYWNKLLTYSTDSNSFSRTEPATPPGGWEKWQIFLPQANSDGTPWAYPDAVVIKKMYANKGPITCGSTTCSLALLTQNSGADFHDNEAFYIDINGWKTVEDPSCTGCS
jgi:hypothetical protein